MDVEAELDCDVVIFGGGGAGLWLLDDLRRRNVRVLLLENERLGNGQTSVAQGILHGGIRYALKGILSASAKAVSGMPAIWQARLAGEAEPNLSAIQMRARWCYLWRNESWKSWFGLQGAKAALQVQPVPLSDDARPEPLRGCPGSVYRLDEPVIDPISFSEIMRERNRDQLLRVDSQNGVEFRMASDGTVGGITIHDPSRQRQLKLRPRQIVLAAGAGNEALRTQIGLTSNAMQRRPLHVPLLRGLLPALNGHCVDGAHTRVTFTAHLDSTGVGVWQLGGQVSEDGVRMEPRELIDHARREVQQVLPGWQMPAVQWSTFRVDRAEARTADGSRPDDVQLLREGNVLTIWPTKLVLVPLMAQRVAELLGESNSATTAKFLTSIRALGWPIPEVASYPWERDLQWTNVV